MLNLNQREVLAEKLMDLGNIAAGSMVFGVLIKRELFNVWSLLLGIATLIILYGIAMILKKGNVII